MQQSIKKIQSTTSEPQAFTSELRRFIFEVGKRVFFGAFNALRISGLIVDKLKVDQRN